MHGTLQSAEDARSRAYSMPLEDIHVGDPQLFFSDSHWPYFERLRNEDPVHYCRDSEFGPYWSVTKYNDIMAVDTNHQVFSSDSALGGITIRRLRIRRLPAAELHRHGPAEARRAAQDRERRWSRRPISTSSRADDPRARRPDPRRPADRRDVRLGRPGLDRTDHADAGDAVRLPVRGAAQADLLVRHHDHRARRRPGRNHRGKAAPSIDRVRRLLHGAVERARRPAAEARPDLDAGARRSHAEHGRSAISSAT